jgi:hypothetical protein
MASKYDYDKLERDYVYGTMSIRQLCKDNGISTWSTVSEYAKRNEWNEKREEYQQRQRENDIKSVVESRSVKLAGALDDAIMVANQAVYAFLDSLKDRWVTDPESKQRVFVPGQTVTAADFVKIMEKVMVLNGQFTSREAHVGMDLTDVTMEMWRDLLRTSREHGAESRPVATSPLPRLEGARTVN